MDQQQEKSKSKQGVKSSNSSSDTSQQKFEEKTMGKSKQIIDTDKNNKRINSWINTVTENKSLLYLFEWNTIKFLKEVKSTRGNEFHCRCCSGRGFTSINGVREHIKTMDHCNKLKLAHLNETVNLLNFPPDGIIAVLSLKLEQLFNVYKYKDHQVRLDIMGCIKRLIMAKCPCYSLKMYGSSYHGLGLKTCDLNLGLYEDNEMADPLILTNLAADLESYKNVKNMVKEFKMCSPVISFDWITDSGETIHIIINKTKFEDEFWQFSNLISRYGKIDQRVNKLCTLFRLWVNICSLDQNYTTWPTYFTYLFVIHFLQQLPIPVLPVLDKHEHFLANITNWEVKNCDSLGLLWLQLLRFYSKLKYSEHLISITQQQNEINLKYWQGKILIEDPYLIRAINFDCRKSLYDYIIQCFKTSYKYFCIPQTKQGPIYGTILEPHIQTDFDIANFSAYVDSQVNFSRLATRMIPFMDSNYLKSFCPSLIPIKDLSEGLDKLKNGDYLNFYNNQLERFQIPVIKKKPTANEYVDLIVFPNEANYLGNAIDSNNVRYKFSAKELINGITFIPFCKICSKSRHIPSVCPEKNLPKLDELLLPDKELYTTLNFVCENVFLKNKMKEKDLQLREETLRFLTKFVTAIYPLAILSPFGSVCNGFATVSSDLDLCLTFKDNPSGRGLDVQHFLLMLTSDLKTCGYFKKIRCIPCARVPIVKLVFNPTKLEVDISAYNLLGPENTKLLHAYSKIDNRVNVLAHMLKKLIKSANIADSSKGGLSSYSYLLMLIYFCQQCNPPVLPVLQEIETKPKFLGEYNVYFYDNIENLEKNKHFFRNNNKTVGELWIDFIRFYTEMFDYDNLVVCIRKKELVSKFDKCWNTICLAIEDPFDINLNLGSRLTVARSNFIIKAFRAARVNFTTKFSDNTDENELVEKYFKYDSVNDSDYICEVCNKSGHTEDHCPKSKSAVNLKLRDLGKNTDTIDCNLKLNRFTKLEKDLTRQDDTYFTPTHLSSMDKEQEEAWQRTFNHH